MEEIKEDKQFSEDLEEKHGRKSWNNNLRENFKILVLSSNKSR